MVFLTRSPVQCLLQHLVCNRWTGPCRCTCCFPNGPLWGPRKEPSPLFLDKGKGEHSCLEASPGWLCPPSQDRSSATQNMVRQSLGPGLWLDVLALHSCQECHWSPSTCTHTHCSFLQGLCWSCVCLRLSGKWPLSQASRNSPRCYLKLQFRSKI